MNRSRLKLTVILSEHVGKAVDDALPLIVRRDTPSVLHRRRNSLVVTFGELGSWR
jgi:hypothetical protein